MSDESKILTSLSLNLPARSEKATKGILGFSEELRKLKERLRESSDYIDQQFNTKMEAFSNQMVLARAHLTSVGITLGAILAPHVLSAVSYIEQLATWFQSLSMATQENIIWWGILAMVIPPVLIVMSFLTQIVGFLLHSVVLLFTTPIGWFFLMAAGVGYLVFELEGLQSAIETVTVLLITLFSTLAGFQVGAAVGALGGFALGGPIGAVIGFAIGIIASAAMLLSGSLEGASSQVAGFGDAFSEMAAAFKKAEFNAFHKQRIFEGVMGTRLDREAKLRSIEGGLRGGVLTAAEAKGLQDTLKRQDIQMAMKANMKEQFDLQASLMEGIGTLEDDLADRTPPQTKPFNATMMGTPEEYRARVLGQQELVKTTDKIFHESKKTSTNTGKSAKTLEMMRKLMESQRQAQELGL
jgi:hypothetical protein